MKTVQKDFLTLVRSGLWGCELDLDCAKADLTSIIKLAKEQSMLGIVGNVLVQQPGMPDTLKKKLKSFLYNNVLTHSLLNKTLHKCVNALNGAGIPYILLKGQGNATYYPNPTLRQCGDIDIYVGHENYRKAIETLNAGGCEYMDISESLKHFDMTMDGVTIEIHRTSMVYTPQKRDAIYCKFQDHGMKENYNTLRIEGMDIRTPEQTFNSYYVFAHLFHHYLTGGIGLRQLCDWSMILHSLHGKIDKERLSTILEEMGHNTAWKVFGCIIVKHLGLPQEEFPFYDGKYESKAEIVLKHILKEGNFGHNRSVVKNRPKQYFLAKTNSLIAHFFRTINMIRVFPGFAIHQFTTTLFNGFYVVWKDITK